MAKKDVHVTPAKGGGPKVKRAGGDWAWSVHDTQAAALKTGRPYVVMLIGSVLTTSSRFHE